MRKERATERKRDRDRDSEICRERSHRGFGSHMSLSKELTQSNSVNNSQNSHKAGNSCFPTS